MKFLIIAFVLFATISYSKASSISCDINPITGEVLTSTCIDLGDDIDE